MRIFLVSCENWTEFYKIHVKFCFPNGASTFCLAVRLSTFTAWPVHWISSTQEQRLRKQTQLTPPRPPARTNPPVRSRSDGRHRPPRSPALDSDVEKRGTLEMPPPALPPTAQSGIGELPQPSKRFPTRSISPCDFSILGVNFYARMCDAVVAMLLEARFWVNFWLGWELTDALLQGYSRAHLPLHIIVQFYCVTFCFCLLQFK